MAGIATGRNAKWFALSMGVALACSERADSEGSANEPAVGSRSAALEVPELSVAPRIAFTERVREEGGIVNGVGIACGTNRCLAAWQQQGYTVGRLLTSTGVPIGDQVLSFGQSDGIRPFTLTAAGTEFLLVGWDDNLPITMVSDDGLVGARIEHTFPAGEQFIAPVVARSEGAVTGVLYGHRTAPNADSVRLLRFSGGALVGPEQGLNLGTLMNSELALGAGGGQFVIAHTNAFRRVDAATGVLLDAGFTPFTEDPIYQSSLAFDGENHLIAWFNEGALYTQRIRAADGAVVDAAPRRICDISNAGDLRLALVGDRLIYSWQRDLAIEGVAVPLSPWNSAAVSCPGVTFGTRGVTWSPNGSAGAGRADDVAFYGTLALRLTSRHPNLGPIGAAISTHDFSTDSPAPGVANLINFHSGPPVVEAVVSSGADFIVLYLDYAGVEHILRVDDETGRPLGPGVELESCRDPSLGHGTNLLASNGTGYLLGEGDGFHHCYRSMDCDGRLGEKVLVPAMPDLVSLVSDGNRYLAAGSDWTGFSVYRVDASGHALDQPTELNPSPATWAIAADRHPDPTQRTFMLLTTNADNAVAWRISSETGTVMPPVTVDGRPNLLTEFLTSDGSQFLGGWRAGLQLSLARLDPASAEPKEPISNALPFDGPDSKQAVFDGTSFITLGNVAQERRLLRFDSALAPLDEQGGISVSSEAVIAANRRGQTLVVTPGFVPEELGYRLYGQLIQTGPPAQGWSEPVCDDSIVGGAGGDGGENAGGGGGDGCAGGISAGGTSMATGGTTDGGRLNGGTTNGGRNGSAGEAEGGNAAGRGGNQPEGGAPSSGGANAAGDSDSGGASAGRAGSPSDHDSGSCACRAVTSRPESPARQLLAAAVLMLALVRRRRCTSDLSSAALRGRRAESAARSMSQRLRKGPRSAP